MEYRLWQNNLTVLQRYETAIFTGVGGNDHDLTNFGVG